MNYLHATAKYLRATADGDADDEEEFKDIAREGIDMNLNLRDGTRLRITFIGATRFRIVETQGEDIDVVRSLSIRVRSSMGKGEYKIKHLWLEPFDQYLYILFETWTVDKPMLYAVPVKTMVYDSLKLELRAPTSIPLSTFDSPVGTPPLSTAAVMSADGVSLLAADGSHADPSSLPTEPNGIEIACVLPTCLY